MSSLHAVILVGVAAVWGLNFSASRIALQSFDPLQLNFLRFVGVFCLLWPFFKRVPGQELRLIGLGVLIGTLHFAFMYMGVSKGVDISALAIATQLNVPFSAVLAVLMLGERVGWRRWLAIGVSFAGVVYMSFDPVIFQRLDAVIWAVMAAFCFGLGAVVMRSLKDVPALTTQSWIALVGMVTAFPLSLLMSDQSWGVVYTASANSWIGVLYASVFASVLAHGFSNMMLRRYDVAMVTPYFLLMPIFAIFGGWVFFGEVLTLQIFIGGALTMLGVTVVTVRNVAPNRASATLADQSQSVQPRD